MADISYFRVYWGPIQGRRPLNFNNPVIDQWSVVHITASEYVYDGPHEPLLEDHSDRQRFIGGADVEVHNVAPHGPPFDPNNGVTFVVKVDWDTPLPIVTDITVFRVAQTEVERVRMQ
jgi:hypothetical protein